MSDEQRICLLERLRQQGWTIRGAFIYAPGETMWLPRDSPWQGDLADFLRRMSARAGRTDGHRLGDWKQVLWDTESLVDVLEELVRLRLG